MKTILAYGDSLTWGYDPEGPGRHAPEDRWPNVLQTALGGKAQVIAEGLNGRTTTFDDHVGPADRNGARLLPTLLTTHAPLDLVIIMLGTNDMKPFLAGAAIAAKQGMERLVDIVRGHSWPLDQEQPEILIVAPPAIRETGDPDFAALFAGAIQQSHMLGSLYSDLADVAGCGFFDAGSVAETSPLDGVHLDAANTRTIGRGVEPLVRMMLGI
ncbi:arylesterase [Nitratireductor sp. CAU 1489]|uniref:Arylesterase n=1 Tax=Nitratireductor arenosus TaxID=2682096 RepID=A0A844QJ42_9HYPH|nr:SGNH/GDSL hydrolase family protein [Nitratireductor arenosus]MVA97719.1 arylesterase [Nitratireductor arenosus]